MGWSGAASRWNIVGRGVGVGATWGLAVGGGSGLLFLPYAFFTVPFGIVLGTSAGLLSGLAAGVLMVLAETARPGGAAGQSRLLGGLGTPLTLLAVFAARPDWFSYSGATLALAGAVVVLGSGTGAALGPFIATGLDAGRRGPGRPEGVRRRRR